MSVHCSKGVTQFWHHCLSRTMSTLSLFSIKRQISYPEKGTETKSSMTFLQLSSYTFLLLSTSVSAQQAIFNSIFDGCGASMATYGCGYNLNCLYVNPSYSQCVPNAALLGSLYQSCYSGQACAGGSYCHRYPYYAVCEVCRTKYSTCGSSVWGGSTAGGDCCPGYACTTVNAIVGGAVSTKQICIPPASPTKRDNFDFSKEIAEEEASARNASAHAEEEVGRGNRLTKRPVSNYCYNGCVATSYARTP